MNVKLLLFFNIYILFLNGMSFSQDSDNDGLSDREELIYGTNVNDCDTDKDGLLDGWEVHGYDADKDGIIDEPLNLFGANPLVKDIFIEIDWMLDPDTFDSFSLKVEGIVNRIGNIFKENGINIHFDIGPGNRETFYTEGFKNNGCGGTLLSFKTAFFERPFDNLKDSKDSLYNIFYDPLFFRKSRRKIFYFFFVASQYSSEEAGSAKVDDFSDVSASVRGLEKAGINSSVIYRKAFQNDDQLTATFLHELGHCLGLGHGGVSQEGNWNNIEGKINYLSVMNPLYELSGVDFVNGKTIFDFSHGILPPLSERSLSERLGLGKTINDNKLKILGFKRVVSPLYPWNIDWNNNGKIDDFTYAFDLNKDGEISTDKWYDFDDWGWLNKQGFRDIGSNSCIGIEKRSNCFGPFLKINWADRNGNGNKNLVFSNNGKLFTYELNLKGLKYLERVELPEGLDLNSARIVKDRSLLINFESMLFQTSEKLYFLGKKGTPFILLKDLSIDDEGGSSGGNIEKSFSFVNLKGPGFYEIVSKEKGKIELYDIQQGELKPVLSLSLPEDNLNYKDREKIIFKDFDGDSIDELLVLNSKSGSLWFFSGDKFERKNIFFSEITTDQETWSFSEIEQNYFEDMNGDGIKDWIICRWPQIGIFLNQKDKFLSRGKIFNFGFQKTDRNNIGFRFGNFKVGGGKELIISGNNFFKLISWEDGLLKAEEFKGTVLETSFWKEMANNGNLFNLLAGDKEALGIIKPDKIMTLELNPLRERIYNIQLSERNLWPCNEIKTFDIDKDGREEIVITSNNRIALIKKQEDVYKIEWIYRWDAIKEKFDLEFFDDTTAPASENFIRGDANGDGEIDISDALFILIYLFGDGLEISCFDGADVNDDGMLDISDAVFLLSYLFNHGEAPPFPGPIRAGGDLTDDFFGPCLRPAKR